MCWFASGSSRGGAAEIRQIAHLDRHQVVRVMKEVQHEEPAIVREGVGKGSRYRYLPGGSERRGL
ncbi:hypothetical protein Metli_2007 [Methanofollis liminatans DSM 4140]|uniref:Uncharacterized protein n=1 Tax=Methanofollis liminatans DSM 4140 TaxID=28892 RepID=J0SB61_9EURY|nr:hypothetical protein Metli_2007 [Methanofollis liminatans DSM 4140]